MKKKLPILFILFIGSFYKSQDKSLAASINTPSAFQTGLPEVSFPIVNLPATKDLNINFGLAYNPKAHTLGSYSGVVARNWQLTGSNFVISRSTIGSWPDEVQNDNNWDDIYYYNLNGEEGSFKFEKSGIFPNDIYKILKLTPSDVSIESERIVTSNSWQPKHIKSFLIKDTKGYKYYFTDYDFIRFTYSGATGAEPVTDLRNTFYIKKIEDPMGREVATFQNKKYIGYTNNSNGTVVDSWYYLPEIVTTSYGTIVLGQGNSNENYSSEEFQLQDSRYINSITLKDKNENFVSKHKLTVSSDSFDGIFYGYKMYRELNRITKVDKDDIPLDKIDFSYIIVPYVPYGVTNPVNTDLGFLNEIRFSSGKKIEYNFGFSTIKSSNDYNDPVFLATLQDPNVFIYGISFYREALNLNIDSKITRKYYLPLSSFVHNTNNTKIKVGFNRSEWYPSGSTENPTRGGADIPEVFQYRVIDPVTGSGMNLYYDSTETFVINPNHNIYLEVIGTGGKGSFNILEKDYLPPPYTNIISGELVLNNIKYYDLNKNYSIMSGIYDLKKSINYNYNLFNEVGIDSGEAVYSESGAGTMIYKNIKVTESDKPGYIKYYFKTPSDFPKYSFPNESGFWEPTYNYTKRGIFHKTEIYSSDNQLKSSKINDYLFPPNDNVEVVKAQNVMPQKITTTDISKDVSDNSLTDISEKKFNQANNNLMSEKSIFADGTISETTYEYAAEKGNSKLLGAGMTSVPLEVIQKQNNIQTGKLETRYDQADNYFPSSVKSFGINNVVTGEQVNDLYDSMGNVLQTTSKSGISTAIIWGYGNTQPIAKIEGAKYADVLSIMQASGNGDLDIVKKSDLDISNTDNTNEQLLRDALEVFRKKPGFKNYLITTYTYDPLIGVKSVTSPNGMTEYYYYDNQNRPIRVEDSDHHIIKENKYQQNVFQD